MLDVSDIHREDHDYYFAAIETEWEGGGREAFLDHLLTLDLSGFNVRRVPQTEALRDQKLLSLPTVDRWFYTRLRAGNISNETHVHTKRGLDRLGPDGISLD